MSRLTPAAAGIGISLALLAAADLWLLPARIGMPRDRFLMGFVSSLAVQDGVRLNALGLTGDVPGPDRDASGAAGDPGLRVLTLGGSVLFNRRFTERLDAALERAAGGPVVTLGASLPSHTSWSSVHKYEHLRSHGFDVVLIYEGINELFADHVAKADFRPDYRHLAAWYDRRGPLAWSVIARIVYNDFVYRTPPRVWNASDYPHEASLRANLQYLVDAVREDGGHPVPMTFAWFVPERYDQEAFFRGEVGYAKPDRADAYPVELWGSVPYVRRGLVRSNLILREVAAEAGVAVLDMETRLRGQAGYFVDVCHLSESGVDAFIGEIVSFLEAEGLLPAPTRP